MNRILVVVGAMLLANSPQTVDFNTRDRPISAFEIGLGTWFRKAFRRPVVEVGEKVAEEAAAQAGQAEAKAIAAAIRRSGLATEQEALQAAQHLAARGVTGAWIAARPKSLSIFLRLGEDAAEAMMKHPGVAEPMIERFGQPAAKALPTLNGQNARRLAIMEADNSLAHIGQVDRLLETIGKHGDAAMDFVWRNKGTLAIGTTLIAFLNDPEPFINGARDIAKVGADAVSEPVTAAATEIGKSTARVLVVAFAFVIAAWITFVLIRKRANQSLDQQSPMP